jgi:hypothetical protein
MLVSVLQAARRPLRSVDSRSHINATPCPPDALRKLTMDGRVQGHEPIGRRACEAGRVVMGRCIRPGITGEQAPPA